MIRKRPIIIIVPALLLLVAVWRLGFARRGDRSALALSGTVEATEAQLGFQAPGRIATIGVREGDAVPAGAELAALDRTELLARRAQSQAQVAAATAALDELERGARREEVRQAQAQLDAARERQTDAERDLARTRTLFEGGAVSREAYDKALTAHAVAASQSRQLAEQYRLVIAGPRAERIAAQRAQVEQARAAVQGVDAALANSVVRAPFDGVVTVRHREAGEAIPAGSPVLTVMDRGDRWVRVYVPETRIGAVRLGMPAQITTDTYRDKRYPGAVAFIASQAEFTPKSVQTAEERVKLVYAVKVRITGDPAYDLKPGMPADVALDLTAPAPRAADSSGARLQ